MRLCHVPRILYILAGVILAVTIGATTQAEAQVQQNQPNQKKLPPAPVRRVPQQVMRPGQVHSKSTSVTSTKSARRRPRGARVIPKPGVIRGPAGAMRMARPANVAFNPRHRVGLAGLHYNHQGFVFRRGHSLFRRAYYLGPGGDVFFYDEPEPATDPAYAAYADDGTLPTCPEDSDDCQGLDQAYERPPLRRRCPGADALPVSYVAHAQCRMGARGLDDQCRSG